MTTIFPVPMKIQALALHRGAISIMIDLACNEPEIWVPLVADGKDETDQLTGYLRLEKRITQGPGLTTYAAVEVRPPHDPPPNPATLKTLFQWPSLEDYVALSQGLNVHLR